MQEKFKPNFEYKDQDQQQYTKAAYTNLQSDYFIWKSIFFLLLILQNKTVSLSVSVCVCPLIGEKTDGPTGGTVGCGISRRGKMAKKQKQMSKNYP